MNLFYFIGENIFFGNCKSSTLNSIKGGIKDSPDANLQSNKMSSDNRWIEKTERKKEN